ncbi:MAG: methylmalonyl Co-A mutase-associated GTPase MeaB [Burkholderiaceae bacterium]|nr:methylmalonyl Co-A mutase-associated GTPase MeaB [Burkholderiaceae bacterium]
MPAEDARAVRADMAATERVATTVDGVRAGRARAIGRAISEVESDSDAGRQIVAALAGHVGRAHRIGFTGPPGAGKSSLVGMLIERFELHGDRVGVIAVDPSSRATGGAILGDRVRMENHAGGGGTFIRSLGSRGETGGLSLAAARAADVLDAAGYDPILLETVGAGQADLEVSEVAHTSVVVLPPGLGDEIQAVKAGVMEIADIFVVSKCDIAGASQTRADLLALLRLRGPEATGIRVIGTSTVDGEGVEALFEALNERASQREPGVAEGSLARLVVRRALRTTELELAALPRARLLDLGARVRRGEITLEHAARAALDAAQELAKSPAIAARGRSSSAASD